jgi:hypothetical protein
VGLTKEDTVTANEIERQKYLRLISEVEDLEERVATLEQQGRQGEELRLLQGKLGAARTELTRVSNGCGQPRTKS